MKHLFFTIFFSVNADLSPYLWKNRVMALVDDQSLQKQQLLFNAYKKDFKERKMIFYMIKKSDSLFKGRNERFFLLGKDGTIKAASREPFKPKEIFQLIDSMPMRMREMKEK